ncbi:HAD-IIIA family hydrolase [Hoyosella sp. YIM 151337]|uniref:HAD-IIIA family hydrolase n=1 Tax=Hoyosella sp. YIM 151337 TaxID=2992742 RepID=UPI002236484D|nr:HAD-IIIA family hydrolase [Hoyosella sp. YIM 151337]MCW4355510.1 HAD-IIIA family hydrolase [Hoyosella sp. YIM 151337]
MSASYSIVIPTIGRESLLTLLRSINGAAGPRPSRIVVVFDRADPAMEQSAARFGCEIRRSGGRGPAAARNVGWQAVRGTCDWVVFLDDDVSVSPEWCLHLSKDLAAAPAHCGGIQARLTVPFPADRKPTDNERRTLGLENARWITADMAYRSAVLEAVRGFDEAFPRAYREDADLALRVVSAGYSIIRGDRLSVHPVAQAGFFASVRAQRGNRDDALMRTKFGDAWRRRSGERPSRLPYYTAITGALVTAVGGALAGRRRALTTASALWLALTARFTLERVTAGPRTLREWWQMVVTSGLIPPVACMQRLRGEWDVRTGRVRSSALAPRPLIQAILFDRDDTLIRDVPYLNDPDGVTPMPAALEAVERARQAGLRVGVVSNQSGVARGLITIRQLLAVNERVNAEFGRFDTWQICVHGEDDGCGCRKPCPAMIRNAARELGVPVESCVMIGDTGADVDAALRAGARAILVPTRRTLQPEIEAAQEQALVAEDLGMAVSMAIQSGAR